MHSKESKIMHSKESCSARNLWCQALPNSFVVHNFCSIPQSPRTYFNINWDVFLNAVICSQLWWHKAVLQAKTRLQAWCMTAIALNLWEIVFIIYCMYVIALLLHWSLSPEKELNNIPIDFNRKLLKIPILSTRNILSFLCIRLLVYSSIALLRRSYNKVWNMWVALCNWAKHHSCASLNASQVMYFLPHVWLLLGSLKCPTSRNCILRAREVA